MKVHLLCIRTLFFDRLLLYTGQLCQLFLKHLIQIVVQTGRAICSRQEIVECCGSTYTARRKVSGGVTLVIKISCRHLAQLLRLLFQLLQLLARE